MNSRFYMKKSRTIDELTKVLFGNLNFDDRGDRVNVKIDDVPCVMQYKDDFKYVDALKVPSLRKELQKEEIYGEALANAVDNYKNMLQKLKKAGYRITKHDFFGPHLLRIVT